MPDITPRIFISYSRKDGETFAADLRTKLADEFSKELVWRDREGMEGGRDWWQQIVEALDHVEYMVLVATPEAMKSPIVKKEWRMARQKGVCVCPIQVPGLPVDFNSLPRWMRDVHFYNLEMEWNTFIAFLTAPCRVMKVPFMAPDLPDIFVERTGPFDQLKALLLDPDRQNPVAVTTALHGAGGFGKTTLAAALCHDEDIQTAFDDGVLWVTLGEKPDLVNALAKLYRALTDDEPTFRDEEEGEIRLSEKLDELDCLIVIDDVWNIAHLRPFMRGGERCSRLFTTRDLGIATGAKAIMTEVDEMTDDESIELLGAGLHDADRSQLSKLAQRLGEYAQMLEIANGMMHERMAVSSDSVLGALIWLTKVLDREGVLGIRRDDQTERKRDIAGLLRGSFELLGAEQCRRLYELGVFKDDEAIPLSSVMRLWRLDEFDTEYAILKMARLTLLKYSSSTSSIRLHDVIREYVVTQIPDQSVLHSRLITTWGDPYALPDVYAWQYYAYHLAYLNKITVLRTLLLDFRWLRAKLEATDALAILADCDYFPNDDTVSLLDSAIRLSLSVLAMDKCQFAPQLAGRLTIHSGNLDIAALLSTLQYPTGTFRSINPERPTHISAQGRLTREGSSRPASEVSGLLVLMGDHLLSWGGKLRLWGEDGAALCVLERHGHSVVGAQKLSDGRLLSWSGSNYFKDEDTLCIWDMNGAMLAVLEGHTDGIIGALELRDGKLLSWSHDKTLRVWGKDGMAQAILEGHTSEIGGAHELNDGHLLSWGNDGILRIWSLNGSLQKAIEGNVDEFSGVLALQDGRFVTWSDKRLWFWSEDGTLLTILEEDYYWLLEVVELADGRLLAWFQDDSLRLIDKNGTTHRVLSGHSDWVVGALELKDGRLLSWSYDRTLRLWGADGAALNVMKGHTGRVNGAVELNDGRLLSWSNDGTLRLWSPDGTKLNSFFGDGWINCCVVLQNSQTIVTGDSLGNVLFLQPV